MIYICIPALDEARTVGILVWKIRRVMAEFPRDYHVLVLDDGSRDETQEVLAPYTRVLPLTVLRSERTLGYAGALERLLREAASRSTHPKRDVAVVLQADFTESPEDIPALIKRMEGGADVVASNAVPVGETTRALRWSRRGLPWLLGRKALPAGIRDPLSGFRAYRISVLRRALQERGDKPLLTRGGWAANAELLLAVAPHARRAEEAEVTVRYDRRERATRFQPWATVREMWDLARVTPRRAPVPAAAAPAAPPAGSAPAPQPAKSAPAAKAPQAPAADAPSDDGAAETQGTEAAPRPRSRGRGRRPRRSPNKTDTKED
ncbi:MAG TPA: glycosyltransferase family 2 protein [Longimicrobiaceae bacterium]|nr:glycosyltransferase family 2 protein [Longimicrobiaceae bacterium]